MNKNILFKWFAGLMVIVIVVSLSACNGTKGSEVKSTDNNENGDGKKTEKITMYVAEPWSAGNIDPSWTDPVAKELTKRTGITVEVTTANAQDPDAQLNVLMASNELPDLIFASGDRRTRLVTGDFVQPLDPLIDQYGPNIKKNLGQFFNNWKDDDGKIYGLGNWNWNKPTVYALNLQINTLQIRYDILKELGYSKLKRDNKGDSFITIDEYMSLLNQVKTKYPDMTPAIMAGDAAYQTLITSKGVQREDKTVYKDGKAYYLYDNPYTEESIKFLNKLYIEGYVPKGFATFKQEENQALIANGKVFSSLGSVDGLYESQAALSEGNDEKRMVMFYLIDNPSVKTIYANGYYGIGPPNMLISKKSKHVEAIMRLLDYMATDEGSLVLSAGVEGVTYKLGADGKKVLVDDLAKGYASWDTNVLKKYGVGGWFNIFPGMAGVDKDGNAFDIGAQVTFDQDKWVNYNNKDWQQFAYSQIVSTAGALTKTKQPEAFDANSKINAYIKDRMIKAIVASTPEASMAEWRKDVQQMKSDGLDKLTEALNANWLKLANALKREPDKLNVVDAEK